MSHSNANVPVPGLLKATAVLARVSLSQRQVDRLVAVGKFPPPVRIGHRTKRWRSADVDRYVATLES